MKKYGLGLDLGVASIGWGAVLLNEDDIATGILDHGVVTFRTLDSNKGQLYNQKRREARGTRRVIRRRKERNRRIRQLLCSTFNISTETYYNLFHEVGKSQQSNALELKVLGLNAKLTIEELSRVLIHYSKNRGFKSNRKIESDSEKGKMKLAIGNIQAVMARDNCTVTQAVLAYQKEQNITMTHNTDDKYVYGFERADVEAEIEILLSKQVELKLIDEQFKEKYIEIWSSQRDFSEGPASGPYRVSFEKMFGFCKFREGEKRISRACPSFDVHNFLTRMKNLSYCHISSDGNKVLDGRRIKYYSLTKEQIVELYSKVFIDKKPILITYKFLKNYIEKQAGVSIEIKDSPSLTRDEFNEVMKKYKKSNNINDRLNDQQYEAVKLVAKNKALDKEYVVLKSFKDLKKAITKLSKDQKYVDIEFMDDIATILAFAQTDKAIENVICSNYNGRFTIDEIEMIKKLKVTNSGTGSLSLSLVQDLNELMLEGMDYTNAMVELGYDHARLDNKVELGSKFPTVKEIEDAYSTTITQPNVKHVLVYLRKFYNELIKKYGEPAYIHIEVAREIKNSYEVRNKIRSEQINHQVENDRARLKMIEVLGITEIEHRTYRNFSQDDVLKFRLWNEQSGYCMYTQERIEARDLLARNEYQIDHILPFSRTFDDSYNNKVLVKTHSNQDKKNKTPFEWLGNTDKWNTFASFVINSKNLSDGKKSKLLMKEDISYDDFTSQSLHATSYVNQLAVSIFKDLLNTDKNSDRVRTFKGTTTSYLRKYYRLNGLTHSIENESYDRNKIEYKITFKDILINSEKAGISITVIAKDQNEHELVYSKKITKNKKQQFRSLEDEEIYHCLTEQHELLEFFEENIVGKNLYDIEDYKFFVQKERELVVAKLAYDMVNGLKSKLNVKNRENHFHHQVDALLVAIMTRSMQYKITKFHQMWQDLNSRDYSTDPDTGEIMNKESIKEYFNIDQTNKDSRFFIPLPYSQFIEELKIKVFERNQDILISKLKAQGIDTTNVIVKYPSFQSNKIVGGKLHQDTIYGRKMLNGKEVNTIRVAVNKIDAKNIKNIYDKDGGQKAVYETIKTWVEKKKAGEPKVNGQIIKKVKMIDTNLDKMIKISSSTNQKGYAQMDELAKIQVFKKDDSERLFFVQIAVGQYLKLKNGNTNFDVQVWWGQSTKVKLLNYSDLAGEGYKLHTELRPGQHITIELSSKAKGKGVCKVIGFTSGMLEIGSILGDQTDLMENRLINKVQKQHQITISTITSIQHEHISILGELCHFDS